MEPLQSQLQKNIVDALHVFFFFPSKWAASENSAGFSLPPPLFFLFFF